jgi:hypothetical protein
LSSIVSEIRIDQRTKQVAAGKNAVLWRGVGLNAVYAMLCDTHVLQKYKGKLSAAPRTYPAFRWLSDQKSSLETHQEVCLASRDHVVKFQDILYTSLS